MSAILEVLLWSVFFAGAFAILCIAIGMAVLVVLLVREAMDDYKRNNPRGRE